MSEIYEIVKIKTIFILKITYIPFLSTGITTMRSNNFKEYNEEDKKRFYSAIISVGVSFERSFFGN